jgi:hypothetical protein
MIKFSVTLKGIESAAVVALPSAIALQSTNVAAAVGVGPGVITFIPEPTDVGVPVKNGDRVGDNAGDDDGDVAAGECGVGAKGEYEGKVTGLGKAGE